MAAWSDLIGTVKQAFGIGLGGVMLKNEVCGLTVRNADDTADADLTASAVNVSGDRVTLNAAASTGADHPYELRRPSSGMDAAVVLTLPA